MMLPLEERLMDAARDVCLRLSDQLTDCHSFQRLSETVERAAESQGETKPGVACQPREPREPREPRWPCEPRWPASLASLAGLVSLISLTSWLGSLARPARLSWLSGRGWPKLRSA